MTDKYPLMRIQVGTPTRCSLPRRTTLTAVFGNDCVLPIWHRPDDDECDGDAFVLVVDYAREVSKGITTAAVNWHAMQRDEAEIRDASPDQFNDDEDDTPHNPQP